MAKTIAELRKELLKVNETLPNISHGFCGICATALAFGKIKAEMEENQRFRRNTQKSDNRTLTDHERDGFCSKAGAVSESPKVLKPMKIGYVRVSSNEQVTDRQFAQLVEVCDTIMAEKISAKDTKRPVYQQLINRLEAGDTLVIVSIDRAFRNTMDALGEAEKLKARGVHFQILNLAIDTSSADGRLAYTVVAAVAQHERERISERVKQGQAIAKAKGVHIGRPHAMSPCEVRSAKRRIEQGDATIDEIAQINGVHPWTVTRALKRLERAE